MNTSPVIAEILFSAAEVAKAAGVSEYELRNFEPGDFGSPGHWRMKGGRVIYTVRGVERLANAFEALERPVAAHCLRVLAKEMVETSARAMPRQTPDWMSRADLA